MWNDLSLAQKSKVMRMAIDNGVRNYDDIKLLYEEASHKFKDGGPKKNNNKSLTEQGVFDMHRSNAQMIIDPLRYNGNPESIVDWDAVNINNTGSMHYDLDNITITAPETKKPEPEVIEKEVPVFISDDDDYRSNRTKRKLKSYTFEEPKRAKDSLVPITPMFMDTPYSDELQGKVNGEYVYDMPNIFAEGGKTTDDNPDIPMYGSTQQEAVVTGHRMPAWNRFWNKNFRSKSGWDKYVDRYYARQQQMQDTNNTPNPNYEVPDALSIAGIIAGTPYNEDIERAKVWDTYNNWKEHSEIIGPHYDPDGNYHNDAYANPSAGYLSNADPVGEVFVLNEALGPLAKFIGRGAQQVMAKAGNQWARNQIMGRAFNNAADASFGFNNRFITTPASSVEYEIKPTIRTSINSSDPKGWTPEQWTEAQDVAIARGDMAEAQRLRDLHFMISAPNTKIVDNAGNPLKLYHGTKNKFYTFDESLYGSTDGGMYGTGVYTTPYKEYAENYGDNIMNLYANIENPVDARNLSINDLMIGKLEEGNDLFRWTDIGGKRDGVLGKNHYLKTKYPYEIVSHKPSNIKLADAVTYDDSGIRIPLGKRDNFNINDIRYGLAPLGFGVPYLMNNNNNQ